MFDADGRFRMSDPTVKHHIASKGVAFDIFNISGVAYFTSVGVI